MGSQSGNGYRVELYRYKCILKVMETMRLFLTRLSIVAGVVSVFVGMSEDSMSIVIGGGLLMTLGVVFIILERKI